ncbi:hypothetical protein ES708_25765 [subsurface metagenome]
MLTVEAGDEATMTVTCSEAIDEDSFDLTLDFNTEGTEVILANVNIWDITVDGDQLGIDQESIEYDLVAPEIFEISAELVDVFSTGTEVTVGYVDLLDLVAGSMIRVSYEISEAPEDDPDYVYVPITDLAGNGLVESVHYCYLEVED